MYAINYVSSKPCAEYQYVDRLVMIVRLIFNGQPTSRNGRHMVGLRVTLWVDRLCLAQNNRKQADRQSLNRGWWIGALNARLNMGIAQAGFVAMEYKRKVDRTSEVATSSNNNVPNEVKGCM